MNTKSAVSYLQKAIFNDINWSSRVRVAWQTLKDYCTQPTDVQHTQAKMPSWGEVTNGITFSTVGERDVAAEVFSRVARHFGCA